MFQPGFLQQMMQMMMQGQFRTHPQMPLFNQMMQGKNKNQQIDTILNAAKSNDFDVDRKIFSEADLKALKLR